MLALQASKSAEKWDSDFEFQISRSPNPRPLSSPAVKQHPHRTSSPLSSFSDLGWAESEPDDDHPSSSPKVDLSASGESGEGTEGENGPRVVRKRMKGAWDTTVDEDDSSPEVKMTSPATVRRAVFPPETTGGRPSSRPDMSLVGLGPGFLSDHPFSSPQVLPSPSHSASSPDPHFVTDFPPHAPVMSNTASYGQDQSSLGLSVSPLPADFLRDGKPRRRLRKRSRVGETPLSGGQSDDDMDDDPSHVMQGSDPADAANLSSSPRQFIARLSKRFSISKGKPPALAYGGLSEGGPSSSSNVPAQRTSGFIDAGRPNGEGGLQAFRRGSMPVHSPSPVPTVSLGRTPSQNQFTSGFHLPTRRNSSSTSISASSNPTSPKFRPKGTVSLPPAEVQEQIPETVLMPPPPMPPTSHHPQAAATLRSSVYGAQPARRPEFHGSHSARSVTDPSSLIGRPDSRTSDRSAPTHRRETPNRTGHRTSSSVNSIPLKTPPMRDQGLPSVVGSPFVTNDMLPMPGVIPTYELQRSVSTPSDNPLYGRRNSLSDLRIPPRVASAQKALREKVGVVKEFATRVEDLKSLQVRHAELQLQLLQQRPSNPMSNSDHPSHPSPLVSPSILHANSADQNILRDVEHKYAQWWEMAEVLIKLAGTGSEESTSSEANRVSTASERARAITLSSRPSPIEPPSTPPGLLTGPPKASPERWRGSTGRTDLSQRQLDVLRSMLNTPVGKSTFTLPSVANLPKYQRPNVLNVSAPPSANSPNTSFVVPSHRPPEVPRTGREDSTNLQQRRASRAGGVKGLKDFLRSLKIGTEYPDLSTVDGKRSVSESVIKDRKDATMRTVGDQSVGSAATRKSPRRPSLASIFRFGKEGSSERRSKSKGRSSQASSSRTDVSVAPYDDSDWERMSIDSLRPPTPGMASGRSTPVIGPNRRRPSIPPPPVHPLPTSPLPLKSATAHPPPDWPSYRPRPPPQSAPADNYRDIGTVEITPENLQPLLMYVRESEKNCAQCLKELSVNVERQRAGDEQLNWSDLL